MPKLIRITTVPISLQTLLRGQHKFMSQYFEVLGVSSPGPELKQVSEIEGIKVVAIKMSRTISPIADLFSLYRLCSLIIKTKPDLVHTHTPKAGTLGMLASWLCGVPVRMHTVAGLPLMEVTGIKRILLNTVEKITYACATKVYPNSFGLEQIILEHKFCQRQKLKVIGNGSSNGIDTAFFSLLAVSTEEKEQTRKTWQINADDFVFVFVGRLVRDKGINELVAAFERINQRFPHTKLLLVGNEEPELDPLTPETRQTIKSHLNIISTGFQTDVRSFLAVSDLLVFPSYREGFPNVPMQAGAMGLPSIVSDINGCNEIIIQDKNGLIIPPKNEAALEAAMQELLENKEKRNFLAQNARPMIVERYEQQKVWKLIKDEYDEHLKKSSLRG